MNFFIINRSFNIKRRRSMLFNSIIREKPYHNLNNKLLFITSAAFDIAFHDTYYVVKSKY